MVGFNSEWLLRKRQFRSLTGVTPEVFHTMVGKLRPGWERHGKRKQRPGRPFGVGGLEDHLAVLLILYRCHITQDFLGCLYGVDKATICRSLRRIERLAVRVLGVKRRITVSAEEAEALIVDATEQAIHRPGRGQHRWYSGKKKRHTIKTEIVVTGQNRIVAVSKPAPGRVHDIEVRRRGPPLPSGARLYADSGYQGLDKDHPATEIPYKKSKTKPLSQDERTYNRRRGGQSRLCSFRSHYKACDRLRVDRLRPRLSRVADRLRHHRGDQPIVRRAGVHLVPSSVTWLVFVMMMFATWAANDCNLYSSSLALAAVVRKWQRPTLAIVAGIIGIGLALAHVAEHMITFLSLLSILIAPISGVVVMANLRRTQPYTATELEAAPDWRWQALTAWGLAVLAGFMTTGKAAFGLGLFSLTTVPTLDAVLVAVIVMGVLRNAKIYS